jgi:hypothetical protein
MLREPLRFDNGIVLSIQASTYHDCDPFEDGLALEDYDTVEVMIYFNDFKGYSTEILPSMIGLDDLSIFWARRGIMGSFVPFNEIFRIKDVLCKLEEKDVLELVAERRYMNGYLDR